ncbi:lens fiber membrane intrinsic protein-like isoform X2 [Ambystoma mexicanum]
MWSSFAYPIPQSSVKQTVVELKLIGMLSAWISVILLLIATSNDFWIVSHDSTMSGHCGLWHSCKLNAYFNIASGTGYIFATRFFMSLATVACLVAGVASLSPLNDCYCGQVTGVFVASISSYAAAVCDIIAMMVFTSGTSETVRSTPGLSYDWCFALGWGALPLSLITGVIYSVLFWKRPLPTI